jgi:predicted nuclease with TOPRIM domain
LSNLAAIETLKLKLAELETEVEEQEDYTKALRVDFNTSLENLKNLRDQVKQIRIAILSLANADELNKKTVVPR